MKSENTNLKYSFIGANCKYFYHNYSQFYSLKKIELSHLPSPQRCSTPEKKNTYIINYETHNPRYPKNSEAAFTTFITSH